jgi:hypothetical protein
MTALCQQLRDASRAQSRAEPVDQPLETGVVGVGIQRHLLLWAGFGNRDIEPDQIEPEPRIERISEARETFGE